MTVDHPRTRNHPLCPICHGPKNQGLIVCWTCFNRHNMRNPNLRCELLIEQHEIDLITQGVEP